MIIDDCRLAIGLRVGWFGELRPIVMVANHPSSIINVR
jgi:hypothetical protein